MFEQFSMVQYCTLHLPFYGVRSFFMSVIYYLSFCAFVYLPAVSLARPQDCVAEHWSGNARTHTLCYAVKLPQCRCTPKNEDLFQNKLKKEIMEE